MTDIKHLKYEDLEKIYDKYFSLSTLGEDFSERIGLLSLTCYLYNKLKAKKPDLTYWSLLYTIGKDVISDDCLKGLSIVCESFGKNCKTGFQTFGLDDKQIPKKIKELLNQWLPF